MQKSQLLFEYSPWFILLCLVVGIAYAYFLYKKGGPWNKKINQLLAATRFLLASILCFLLLGPFLRQIKNTIEKPTYVFAIDNSTSILKATDSVVLQNILNQFEGIGTLLGEKEFNTEFRTFEGKKKTADEIVMNHGSTNLNSLLKNIQTDYESKNIAGVILLSDGIYNQGVSPTFAPYSFPVHTLGVGDTIARPDVNINAIYYNKIAYQGNKFPILIEVTSNRLSGKTVEIMAKQGGKMLAKKTLALKNNNSFDDVELLIEANKKGLQHYTIEVSKVSGEFSIENNRRSAYVDVIEGKQKILLIAKAPHPDIKALQSVISNNENYQLDSYIPGINKHKVDKYDLVILYQLPDKSNTAKKIIDDYLKKGTSTLFVYGNQTNERQFNAINGVLNISTRSNQPDKVLPSFNTDFQKFLFEKENQNIVNQYTPVYVPYSDFKLKPGAETILYQKIGSVKTKKPLLAIGDNKGVKSAVMLGESFWQWRLQEYATHESHVVFNELFSKLIQYLSSKEDKRKFKVYPISNEIFDSEKVAFETEIYNNVYERIYGQEIKLTITDEENTKHNYNYVISESNAKYEVSGLPEGIYKYTAKTKVDGKSASSSGEFTIKRLQIEAINLTANHQLLRNISTQSGGKFYKSNELESLKEGIAKLESKGIIHSNEAYLSIINMSWLFFVLLLLVSIEWFTRKYNGGY